MITGCLIYQGLFWCWRTPVNPGSFNPLTKSAYPGLNSKDDWDRAEAFTKHSQEWAGKFPKGAHGQTFSLTNAVRNMHRYGARRINIYPANGPYNRKGFDDELKDLNEFYGENTLRVYLAPAPAPNIWRRYVMTGEMPEPRPTARPAHNVIPITARRKHAG